MLAKERQSNIELLRCFLMLLVVIEHFIFHGILRSEDPINFGDPNFLSSNLLASFCIGAVNCFVLISGYFGIKFTLRKFVLFLLPIFFYEVLMSAGWFPYRHHISFTPFNYWFVRSFVALMLLSPLLNKALESISKRQLQFLLVLLIFVFIVPMQSFSGNGGRNPFMFVILYITGFYVRNHCSLRGNWWAYFVGYVLFSILVFSEVIFFSWRGAGYEGLRRVYDYDSILVYIASILLFITFVKIKINSKKLINTIAGSAFFVYIISENENMYKRPYSIYELIGVDEWAYSAWYPLYIVLASIILFIICIVVDMTRKRLFSRLEAFIGSKAEMLEQKINRQ